LKTPFSQAEDEILLALQKEHGNKWSLISRQLPGRTENAVKLRHHALMRAYGASLRTASLEQQQQPQQIAHPAHVLQYPPSHEPSSAGAINVGAYESIIHIISAIDDGNPAHHMYLLFRTEHQQTADESVHKRQRTGGILEQYAFAQPGMLYYVQPGYLPDPAQHPSYSPLLAHLQTSLHMPSTHFSEQMVDGAARQQERGDDAIFAPDLPQVFEQISPSQDQDTVQKKAVVPVEKELACEDVATLRPVGGCDD
jgi:hypothetical protein